MGDIKKSYSIKFRADEDSKVLEFARIQSNFNDTIRYLIEKEIYENGIRNLQNFIPQYRDQAFFESALDKARSSSRIIPATIQEVEIKNVRDNNLSEETQNKIAAEEIISKEIVTDRTKSKEVIEKNPSEEDFEIPSCYD